MASSSTSDPGAAGKQPVTAAVQPGPKPAPAAARPLGRPSFFDLRRPIPWWQSALFALACIAICGALWWFLTSGEEVESRRLSPTILPSPAETFGDFRSLWFDRELTRNTYASLKRVTLGFGLAALVGVPLGVLCGCFPWLNSFFSPLTIIGRNIPVAAVIPLTFSLFGIGEFQKIMFIFIACVAFVIMDSATAVADVSSRYIDTAFTLGANRRQTVLKVLVPLALPNIFNSLRVLFGLAFGYIMLAEMVKYGSESGGLGDLINNSLKRGLQADILLVLMIIPLVALAIDRLLYWVQSELFPHQYGGSGILNRGVKAILRSWEDFKSLFIRPAEYPKSNLPGASK